MATKPTLKELIYKTLCSHADPMTPRSISEYIGRAFDRNTNDHTVSKTLCEMHRSHQYALKDVLIQGANGARFKAWYVPQLENKKQGELF